MDEDTIQTRLERRLGAVHARQRLGIEADHEAQCFGQGLNFMHIENWYSVHSVIRTTLRLCGLYRRGCRNAGGIRLRRNTIRIEGLPAAFDGFTLLHLSDLHADMSGPAMARVAEILPGLTYDLCVLTGDYRGKTFGPFDAAITGVAQVLERISGPVYGVLGNHDTIQMVPDLEDLGVRVLLNEAVPLRRENARLHLAGIDDAHFFRVDNIEKAAAAIPAGETAILLSHTPEIYRQAAHAGFSVLLSGHTHGGQICLPGGYPITLDSDLPRRYGAGAWRYGAMSGYTSVGAGSSVVAVRLNCPPEITLHRLERAAAQ
ncbi:MAG: metallophosphoesterase [Geminicoccaceae bacterium]